MRTPRAIVRFFSARSSAGGRNPSRGVQSPMYGVEAELRLQACDALDRPNRRQLHAPEQQLARQRGAVELALREDALGHGSTLTA